MQFRFSAIFYFAKWAYTDMHKKETLLQNTIFTDTWDFWWNLNAGKTDSIAILSLQVKESK